MFTRTQLLSHEMYHRNVWFVKYPLTLWILKISLPMKTYPKISFRLSKTQKRSIEDTLSFSLFFVKYLWCNLKGKFYNEGKFINILDAWNIAKDIFWTYFFVIWRSFYRWRFLRFLFHDGDSWLLAIIETFK
jgi:hypothetical protein